MLGGRRICFALSSWASRTVVVRAGHMAAPSAAGGRTYAVSVTVLRALSIHGSFGLAAGLASSFVASCCAAGCSSWKRMLCTRAS
jgi:hypothetical protein